ncbi:hypothetical protein LSH36_3g30072 [Paralvinella palmiformis]|uniref:Transmembrane protein 131 n=1 Tax=Paralvinella palmiformis TaxID=53620 RepID=A0AAD9KFZ4_9ANNE|nr:hypothetical protein LSH36_3g30072 [Paralvinella palmiformis]
MWYAFIQTDNELRYMGDGVLLQVLSGEPDYTGQDGTYSSSPITFDPAFLDFEDQPVGMPHMQQVTVQNLDPDKSLHLLSISGSTQHFHCSFFQDKKVPPGGNTTFEVVFLARQVGSVENTLFIHTSERSYKYQVFGVGIPNPYRIRPILGAKVPVNSSFSPLIHMHNPHSSTLQVQEIFTTGGDLHLELPTGEKEAPRELWEIPPFETKPIMKASFLGRIEDNHTAFIRIRTNKEQDESILVLPVEVEVSSAPGIYSPLEMLDFGILRTQDEPKTLRLSLLNSGPKPVYIMNITVHPPNPAVSIEFRPTQLKSDVLHPAAVALISFNGDSPSVNITRDFTVTNTFNFTLVIYNITLGEEMQEYFSIENFSPPVFLAPQQSAHVITLRFNPQGLVLHFNSELQLHTNASCFSIPISVYDGMLKVIHHRPETQKGRLDFGTLGVGERRSMKFTLRNDNPVDVTVTKYYNNMDKASVELVGVEKGNGTFFTFVLPPYHFAVFTVNLIAPNTEGHRSAQVMIFWKFDILPQKESKELFKYIPITLTTAEGSLKLIPPKLLLEQCFPGKNCRQNLIIHSSFRVKMSVWEVTFSPADNRFYYISRDEFGVPLAPYKDTDIGTIYFDLKRDCQEECYVGLPTQSHAGHHWLLGCGLNKDVADTDQINVTMNIDTDKAHGFLFQVQAHLRWPSIAKKRRIQFPLSQIGNVSVTEFLVENPADVSVVIQVLPLSSYPSPHTVLELLADSLFNDLSDFIDTEDATIFNLPPLVESSNSTSDIESILGVKPHRNSIAILLPGGKTKKIKVEFRPKDDTPKTSLLLIRNNLTIIDAVVLTGQGGRGELRFSNRKPGSNSPLLFEMTDKHLKNCDKKRQNKSIPPNFSVKRTFTARNIGQLPFYVHGFSISSSPCEGYGFKVLDCHGFELLPNNSRKIDLVFTPDFTMSRIRRVLTLHTSLGPTINYTLQATIPAHMLSKCAAALPRPQWEPIIYYSTICIMGFLLFCIFVAAYFEADRIFHSDMFQRRLKVSSSTQTFDKGKVFDLKTIAGVRGHDGQASPTCQYQNSRIASQVNNNSKGYSIMSNGHMDMIPPHMIRRSRKETPPRNSRLLLPLRFLWNTIWNWSWTSGDGSFLAAGGVSKDSSSPGTVSYKSHKNAFSDKNSQDGNGLLNGKGESNRSRRTPNKESSWLTRVFSLITSLSVESSKSSPTSTASKKQHVERTSGKSTQNNVQHSHADHEVSMMHHSNRKTTDRDPSMDRVQLPQEPVMQQLVEDDADDEETIRKEVKKSKQKKYRIEQKRPRERYTDLDRDDTSSTTTESSSCLETDDKAYSTRDTTPDLQLPKNKKVKSKSRREKVKTVNKEEDDNEEEYIITSKSKALKVIKGDTTDSFGGNILRPSTLELPYTTKLEARQSSSGVDQLGMITATSGPLITGRNGKSGKTKTRNVIDGALPQDMNSADDVYDQGDTVWDMPSPQSPGDLGQLSLQTEHFLKAQQNKLGEDLAAIGSHSPTLTCSVSPSLNDLSVMKTLPGKYPPTPGGMESNSPTSSSKHPGAIGSKPLTQNGISSGSVYKKSPWSQLGASGASPCTPEPVSMNSTFGLCPVQEDIQPTLVSLPDIEPLKTTYQNNIFPGLQDGLGPLNVGTYGQQPASQPVLPETTSSSVLMQLQAERRKRRLEYQQNLHSREDWTGFDMAHPHGGTAAAAADGLMWNQATSVPNTTDGWSTLSDSPQHMADMWGSNPVLPVSTSGDWSTSMWGASSSELNRNNNSPLMNLTPPLDSGPTSSAQDAGSPSFIGRFDPFSTMASIWNPPVSNAYNGSNWGLSGSDKPEN